MKQQFILNYVAHRCAILGDTDLPSAFKSNDDRQVWWAANAYREGELMWEALTLKTKISSGDEELDKAISLALKKGMVNKL